MTSSRGLSKLISSNLLSKSLFRPLFLGPATAAAVPTFTVRLVEEDDDYSYDENDERTLRDGFFSDVMFSPSSRGRFEPTARETGQALHIRFEMPGLSKDDVKVTVEDQNTLVIKGEARKGSDEDVHVVSGKYESKLDLTDKWFKITEVKAEMKNGVLNLVVPKVKEDEAPADVISINVD